MQKDRYHHLLSYRVQKNWRPERSGGRRRVRNPDAVPLNYGYPYADSYELDALVQACAEAMEEDGPEALRYGGGPLAGQLDGMILERCRQRGMDIEEDGLMVTHGSAQGITLVCDTFLDVDDHVIVEAPTYMVALRVFGNYCAQVHPVDMDGDGVIIEELESVLSDLTSRGEGVKFFYTIPNFHNPAGATMSEDRRRRLLELAAEYDFMLIEDDAYGELRYEGEDLPLLSALDEGDRVVHLGSMSKILAPGFRLGWIVGPAPLVGHMGSIKADGGTNPFVRSMIAAYWRNLDVQEHLDRVRAGYRMRRDAAFSALEEHMPEGSSWSRPEGGYFLWLTVPEPLDVGELLEEIADEGAMPLPGTMFFPDGRGTRNLRVSFSYPDPGDLESGIAALGRVLKRHL